MPTALAARLDEMAIVRGPNQGDMALVLTRHGLEVRRRADVYGGEN